MLDAVHDQIQGALPHGQPGLGAVVLPDPLVLQLWDGPSLQVGEAWRRSRPELERDDPITSPPPMVGEPHQDVPRLPDVPVPIVEMQHIDATPDR